MCFSSKHGKFSRTDPRWGHKISFTKLTRMEIIDRIFSNYGGIKLELNKWSKCGKHLHIWHWDITFLTRLWLNEEIRRKISKYLALNKNKNRTWKIVWNPGKAMSERKRIGAKSNTGKEEKSKINKLSFLHNFVAKEQNKCTYFVWFGDHMVIWVDVPTSLNLHLKLVFLFQWKLCLNAVYLENINQGSNELMKPHKPRKWFSDLLTWMAKTVPFLDSFHRCHGIPPIFPSFLAHCRYSTL